MKLFLIALLPFLISTTVSDNIDPYKQAKDLIIYSKEYSELRNNKKDYHVSNEVLPFSIFSSLHEPFDNSNFDIHHKTISINESLQTLNVRKSGKVKIFFSEQNNNTFFAEVFSYKKTKLHYSERPTFGARLLYTFTINNNKVTLLKVGQIHYN